jgi:hypothetical protein
MAKPSLAALVALPLLATAPSWLSGSTAHAQDEGALLNDLRTIKTVGSTVPANGDLNPYGVALVKRSVGRLQRGHILVSNFNNKANQQGTGTTIVDVAPNGTVTLFAEINASALPGACPGGVGLTTALVVLKKGWVIVGSLPTKDGTSATAQAGCLIVLDNQGKPVETFSGSPINGPWDMTAADGGDSASLFFTNVLNGTVAANGQVVNQGTVVRLDLDLDTNPKPAATGTTVIASGLSERTDPTALVIGPTGVGLNVLEGKSVLYIADTLNSRIATIDDPLARNSSAGTGATLSRGGALNGPLGLAVTLDGDVLTVNGGDGFIVETSPEGVQVAKKLLDNTGTPPGAGALFGLAVVRPDRVYFVDDNTNTLNLLH